MRALMWLVLKTTRRAALCALVLFCAVPAQATTPNAQQLAAYQQVSETERVRLLMGLAKTPEADQVAFLLQRFPLQGPYAANRTLFIEGIVLKTKGKLTQAAKNFRAVLANDPSLTMVRAELAETLVALQQDDSALHQLRLLAAEAPDEQAASGIRSFIDKVDSRRPYTMSGYVSLAPSTNVNSGSRHTTVYSPALGMTFATEQPKSGIGVATGLSGAYTQRLGNSFTAVATAGADARLYTDSTFNSYGLSEAFDLRYMLSKGYLAFGAVSSQQFDNQTYEPNYLSYGPRISMSLQLTPQNHLSASVLREWRHNIGAGTPDTKTFNLDAAFTHAWNASLNATVFGGFDDINTGNPVSSYRTFSAGLSVYKELPHGITATVMGQLAKTDHKAYNALAGKTRADRKLSSSITLTKRDLNIYGFAPSVNYAFTDNFSNINTYDYVSHSVDFRLTHDF